MGQRFEHACGSCGYSAVVSGGPDIGVIAVTATIVCFDCQKLFDIVTMRHGHGGGERSGPFPIQCPNNKNHRAAPWKIENGCPKCGQPMANAGIRMFFD